jgi:hypothetical protein
MIMGWGIISKDEKEILNWLTKAGIRWRGHLGNSFFRRNTLKHGDAGYDGHYAQT